MVFIGIPKRGNKVHHSQDGYKRLDHFHGFSISSRRYLSLGGIIFQKDQIRFLFRLNLVDDGSVFFDIMSDWNVFWGRLAISDCIFPCARKNLFSKYTDMVSPKFIRRII